jgi:succinoglycan biosynthesis transport protein ExoP
MRPSAAEALKAAIRRSLPIVGILVLIGIVTLNGIKQIQGSRYAATSRVYHTTTDLSAALTNIDPGFVDPERAIDTALTLAASREPYERAARRVGGTGAELQNATTVSGSDEADVIAFTATTGNAERAIRIANAVGDAYVNWRADIQSSAISRAIAQIQNRLKRQTSRENRADLEEQLDRLTVLQTLASGGATVIERASSAPKVSPAPMRDSLLGASLGFVIALLLAGAREAFNTRVRSEADVEDALSKPVLATIQTLPKRAGIVAAGRHESRWGDTYALLAANLMQIRGGNGARGSPTVLAVTSSIAGEGKTTTAANLAVAMALRGQRVVLAEFDLRKPAVGRMFMIPPDSPGIIQLVDGQASIDSATWNVELNGAKPSGLRAVRLSESGNGSTRHDEGGWLRVVPAGGNERGARVARSPQVPELLARLGANADVVILDTPPALSTVEMAELSASVDAVLVVVRHGRVTRRSLLALSRQAEGWRSVILGAVLTDSPAEEDEYYYKG